MSFSQLYSCVFVILTTEESHFVFSVFGYCYVILPSSDPSLKVRTGEAMTTAILTKRH